MLLIDLVLLFILIYIIIILSYSMFWGAPFAALNSDRIKTMIKLLKPVKGKKFLDLGSGDGRIVLEVSRQQMEAYGYEINPLLVLFSKLKLKKNNSIGKIFLKDYWHEDLSEFDYIAVWGQPSMMRRLEKKLQKELKPGAKVVSNHFKFPNWKPEKFENDVYLYIKK